MRKLILTFFVLGITLGVLAQPYTSTKGSFEVNQRLGCAPLTINITQIVSNTFVAAYYYEGDPNITTTSTTHTFNTPGSYLVKVTYNAPIPNSTDNTDNITIVVTENIQPSFEISTCSNNQVSIKVTDTKYNQYLVDFDNDNVIDNTIISGGTQTANFQYPNNTNKTITVRGRDNNGADNCNKNSQVITPLTSLPAATINTLTVTSATSIALDYTPAKNIQYRGLIATNNNSNFQIFQSFNSAGTTPQSLIVNNLITDNNYYCYRLNSYDPCNNISVPSNTICSAILNLTIANKVNQLTWTTATTNITNYNLKRDQANYQTIATSSYDDTAPAITCNTEYCYQVVSNYSNGTKSISIERCGTAISNDIPTAINDVSSVFNGDQIDLSWQQDPAFTAKSYSINRSVNGSVYNSIGSSTTTNYTDNSLNTSESNCYNINYLDACDNTSANGITFCPIQLIGFTTGTNEVNLSWTDYMGWQNGVLQYKISKYDQNGTLLATYTSTTNSYQDNVDDPDHQVLLYVITAIANDAGLTNSVSNQITITKTARLIFPTAFTPNKDKLNDTFTVKGQFVESMTLQIFDRWGTMLYSTDSNEPWDGTHQGRLMPESVYVWKALITEKTGKLTTKVGSVALLHN